MITEDRAVVQMDADGGITIESTDLAVQAWVQIRPSFLIDNRLFDETRPGFTSYEEENVLFTKLCVSLLSLQGWQCDEEKLCGILGLLTIPGPCREFDPANYMIQLNRDATLHEVPELHSVHSQYHPEPQTWAEAELDRLERRGIR